MNDYDDDELTKEESNQVICVALEIFNNGKDDPAFADSIIGKFKKYGNHEKLGKALIYLLQRN
jgi:hypothetical protein